jgi:prophage antirepressor-like protein
MTAIVALKNLSFEGSHIRVDLFDEEPWWVARDISLALDYAQGCNITSLIDKVPDEWKGSKPFATLGGVQEMLCLSEQGLYFFLGRSDKPKALPFQKWVYGEVIPKIRKTGKYEVVKRPSTTNEVLLEVTESLHEVTKSLVRQEKVQEEFLRKHRSLDSRVQVIEKRAINATRGLEKMPNPTGDPGQMTTRVRINRIVRAHCFAASVDHQNTYTDLYRELRDRFHIDLKARAKNANSTPLDIAEELGVIEQLYAVAYDMYVAPVKSVTESAKLVLVE